VEELHGRFPTRGGVMAVSPSATAACHTLGRSVTAEGRAPELWCGAAAAQDVIFAAAREAPSKERKTPRVENSIWVQK
jgi:hypothetical protein